MEAQDQGLKKEERLCSKKLIDTLFSTGGSRAVTVFPLKVVYRLVDVVATEGEKESLEQSVPLDSQMLISVPKKCFKRAVKRNRVKRQVREAYRKHKNILTKKAERLSGKQLLMAFIWLSDELSDSIIVEQRVSNLLHRIEERI